MKTFVVIGLGRFGASVARELYDLGHEVLVIDEHEDEVSRIADSVTHAVVGDATDEGVLRAMGVRNYDCAIVAIGEDISASVLITLNLKELGLKQVICKARSTSHAKALEKIGADRVVFPEREMAVKLAQGLSSANVISFIELSADFGIAEIDAPRPWCGKSIKELNVRARFGINILAIKDKESDAINVSPGADEVIGRNDVLVVIGENSDVSAVQEL